MNDLSSLMLDKKTRETPWSRITEAVEDCVEMVDDLPIAPGQDVEEITP